MHMINPCVDELAFFIFKTKYEYVKKQKQAEEILSTFRPISV